MARKSRLTAYHRLPLHLAHALAVLLTTLLLILGGVSGPGTQYWWVSVTYVDGVDQVGRQQWDLGGLGACVAGPRCTAGQPHPPYWSIVHAALFWHVAAGCLFLGLASATYTLILFPSPTSLAVHWWTLFLPPLGFFIPLITMIVDFAVRSSLITNPDIEAVNTKFSFWLSTLSLIIVAAWAILAEYIRWLALQKIAPPSPVRKPAARKWDPWVLWPWGKQASKGRKRETSEEED